jgi:uncharacterized protein YgbK (DUF1537 family)
MSVKQATTREQLFASLPAPWPEPLLASIRAQVDADGRKIVVLDDDPTGTQAVHDVPVLTEWSVPSLVAELSAERVLFYILTNSRSVPLAQARRMNQEIGKNLLAARDIVGRDFVVVSRSDSTLRGHFPGEVAALAGALDKPFDGWIIVPALLEAGRYTISNIHYVLDGEHLVPAAATPFARDTAFGYGASDLREWVQEKTGGAVPADRVVSIPLDIIRRGGPDAVGSILSQLGNQTICVVDAAATSDLEVVICGLLRAEAMGKRFLYRTAASFVRVRAGLSPRPLLKQEDMDLPPGGGLILVGSYVPQSTRQIEAVRAQGSVVLVEVDVRALLSNERAEEIARVIHQAEEPLAAGQDVMVFTRRQHVQADDAEGSLSTGQHISNALVKIVRGIKVRPRYLLAKGGITSSDIATAGLGVRRATVLGQILEGVPVWRLGDDSRYPGLAYIVFPGNVGGDDALARLTTQLRRGEPHTVPARAGA